MYQRRSRRLIQQEGVAPDVRELERVDVGAHQAMVRVAGAEQIVANLVRHGPPEHDADPPVVVARPFETLQSDRFVHDSSRGGERRHCQRSRAFRAHQFADGESRCFS